MFYVYITCKNAQMSLATCNHCLFLFLSCPQNNSIMHRWGREIPSCLMLLNAGAFAETWSFITPKLQTLHCRPLQATKPFPCTGLHIQISWKTIFRMYEGQQDTYGCTHTHHSPHSFPHSTGLIICRYLSSNRVWIFMEWSRVQEKSQAMKFSWPSCRTTVWDAKILTAKCLLSLQI